MGAFLAINQWMIGGGVAEASNGFRTVAGGLIGLLGLYFMVLPWLGGG